MKVRIALVPQSAAVKTGVLGGVRFSEIVEEVMSTMAVVLKSLPGTHRINKVVVVTTCLELATMHPGFVEYKQCLIDSLNDLANVLMSDGLAKLSQKTRALSSSVMGL